MKEEELLSVLKERFLNHQNRHLSLDWEEVVQRLTQDKLEALKYMEETEGSPDVVSYNGKLYFFDFSLASPKGRRSLCYDSSARISRKKNSPISSAKEEAEKHGLVLLTEDQYFFLQKLQVVDETTSSWIETEEDIRTLGGAIFGSHHYGRTFIYHNSAESYYANRGFRAALEI